MNLSEKKLQELKNRKISIEDLYEKYFYTQQDGVNVENILKLLNENICSFQKIVDKFKRIIELDSLLDNKEIFEKLIQNNKLNKDDWEYLLNRIGNKYELNNLLDSLVWTDTTPLIQHILNEFVLNKEDVDKFNRIMIGEFDWCTKEIHTIFDLIEYYIKYIRVHKDDHEEILKLNELNRKVYLLNNFDLNKEQQLELIEVLRDNEIAQNRLNEIFENHLESNYDFESLMSCLKKEEKKAIFHI